MLIAAFVILGFAVLLGSVLAVLHLQTESSMPPRSFASGEDAVEHGNHRLTQRFQQLTRPVILHAKDLMWQDPTTELVFRDQL
jgi:hypothetical protein